MQTNFINIKCKDILDLTNYFKAHMKFDFENSDDNCVILIQDGYSLFNSNYQANVVIMKLKENGIQVDLVGVGGETGKGFSLFGGSESDFILYARDIIINYATDKNLDMETL